MKTLLFILCVLIHCSLYADSSLEQTIRTLEIENYKTPFWLGFQGDNTNDMKGDDIVSSFGLLRYPLENKGHNELIVVFVNPRVSSRIFFSIGKFRFPMTHSNHYSISLSFPASNESTPHTFGTIVSLNNQFPLASTHDEIKSAIAVAMSGTAILDFESHKTFKVFNVHGEQLALTISNLHFNSRVVANSPLSSIHAAYRLKAQLPVFSPSIGSETFWFKNFIDPIYRPTLALRP